MVGQRTVNTAAAVAVVCLGLVTAGCGSTGVKPGAAVVIATPSPGPTVVPTSTGCPTALPAELIATVPGLDKQLVPIAADQVRLCAYRPLDLDPAAGPLAADVLVTDRATVDRLRSVLNGLPQRPKQKYNCPVQRGYSVLEIFTGAVKGQLVEVRQDLDGCRTVVNGHRVATVAGSDAGTLVLSLLPPAYRQQAPDPTR